MRVVVLHTVNGATKTCEFEAARPMAQLHDGGIAVALRGPDGRETGFALFSTGGLVALMGAAADQYQGLPPATDTVRAEESTDAR